MPLTIIEYRVCGVAYCPQAERIVKAFDDAHLVVAGYLQPGPQHAEETLRQLISVIDNREAQMLSAANTFLFDHLIGAGKQRWWNAETSAFAVLRFMKFL